MRVTIKCLVYIFIIHQVVAPPVTQKKSEDGKQDGNEIGDEPELGSLGIEYNRYLKEVVTALESDPEFREKLEKAEEVDIRTGKIAHELEYVNHHVRTKLDELKRQELERLRHFANKEYELQNDIDTEHLKIIPEHVDHSNPHTFEIEDLRKLIAKTTADLAEVDKKRREEFKEYEMQKEFEKQETLKELDDEHKKTMQQEIEEKEQKHRKHEPLHHPGSKQQLEEVWEKQDHMENQEFDPKTFFHLHDLDGNGLWDEDEVKALFLKELDKLYNSGAPEDDMRERAEEMERMREHVFKEADVNRDGLISYKEFLAQTQKPEFEKDEGWDGIDQQTIYTQQEYEEFERRRQEDVQRMIAQGLIPPHPNGMPPPGYHHGAPPDQHHLQGQNHPGQVPQYHPNQMPQGQYHPNQAQQAYHPNQVPQYHPNQVPQGQFHPGQVQQGQMHPGQVPQGQMHPGQVQQGQMHPGQIQQGQMHPGKVQHGQIHPGQVQQGQMHPGQVQQGQMHPGQVQQAQMHPGQVQQGQMHPGQVPQGQMHPGQVPQGQMHTGQVPQGQMHTGQVPQGQIHPGQVPQGQMHTGQVPQGQIHTGEAPQGQMHTGQVPQGQIHTGQAPQGQMHTGQVPQGQIHAGQVPQVQVNAGQIPPKQVPQEHIQEHHQQQAQAIVQQHHQANDANKAADSNSIPILQHPQQVPLANEVRNSEEQKPSA